MLKGSFSPFPRRKKQPGKRLLKCAKSSEKLIGFLFGITLSPTLSANFTIASVGFFALIVVFQQEIRKFLLLIGSTNFASKRSVVRYFNFLNQDQGSLNIDLKALLSACNKMANEKTGAIIVLERENNLDFLHNTGDEANIELSGQILETIFFKNSPLHDGAVIVKNNFIKATRVVLPVSESASIPSRFGLRHRAAIGISEKTDAVVLVISEQSGKISYIKDGVFCKFKSIDDLMRILNEDLSL